MLVGGLIVISATIFFNIARSSRDISSNTDTYYRKQIARNVAQGGVNLGLRQLSNNRDWRTGFPLMSMSVGKVSVRAVDTTFSGRAVIAVMSTGFSSYGTSMETGATSIAYVPAKFQPPFVKAAVSTNNDVGTNGGLVIDGRDHTPAGGLVAGSGTLAVWTTKTYSQGGASTVGGTSGGVDYAPAKPGAPQVIKQNQPGPYPGSPDSVLGGFSNGFPEGTLKAIAQSGAGGSQYTTNPALLLSPFRGVTYVELPSGGTWQDMIISGSGILIVHNAAKNAIMKNLDSGTFKGMLIADDIVHVHSVIIGAVVSLTPSPSEGNVLGNGSGSVLFSRQSILNSTDALFTMGQNGSQSNVIAWKE